jgi:hypothetical protein
MEQKEKKRGHITDREFGVKTRTFHRHFDSSILLISHNALRHLPRLTRVGGAVTKPYQSQRWANSSASDGLGPGYAQ